MFKAQRGTGAAAVCKEYGRYLSKERQIAHILSKAAKRMKKKSGVERDTWAP